VTLAQYRTLVILANGPSRLADLAEAMGVNPSTATRMCDRLVRKQLIERTRDQLDRREVGLSLTADGQALVSRVTERRRQLVRGLLKEIPPDRRSRLVEALTLLSGAAGTTPSASWSSGWTTVH
jgi:DNA-binding MarR family transcriptional regulator